MNELFLTLGLEAYKPVLTALLLPPVPFLLLVLLGARLMFNRRLLAWLLVLLGVAGLWLSCTEGLGLLLTRGLLRPPPALGQADIDGLKHAPRTTIVVLGAGRRILAPEYGFSTLVPAGIERLRYGLWLSRETGLPAGFSGGVGHGGPPGPSEAEIAARTAEREFVRPLKWTEGESRDTRENAARTLPLLQAAGYEQIVLVTEWYHMPRALRNFERAAGGKGPRIVAAPMAVPSPGGPPAVSDWLPTRKGYLMNSLALHEWLGLLAGA